MKRFYYLDDRGEWRGPFFLPQVIYFTLANTITPNTLLWHNKLYKETAIHPTGSIFQRKEAHEYSFLPIWIFGRNLKIMLRNSWKRLKKWIKRDEYVTFMETPLPLEKQLEKAERIYLLPTLSACNDFIAPRDYRVKLVYRDRNDEVQSSEYPLEFVRDNEPGLGFKITMNEPPGVGGVLYHESYGLHRSLSIVGNGRTILVQKKSVFGFSTKYPHKPQTLNGRFKQANSESQGSYQKCFNRLFLTAHDDKITDPQDILTIGGHHLYDHDHFNIDNTLMGKSFKAGGAFTEVVIAGNRYKFYGVNGNGVFIDGTVLEDLSDFRQKAYIIRIAFALISGKFYGGACWYCIAEEQNFNRITGIWYEMEMKSVITNRRAINLRLFRENIEGNEIEKEKHKEITRSFDPKCFSILCEALLNNEILLHAANLLVSGMGNHDPLQQGALYSVALEALTNKLSKGKADELKPIPNKITASAFKHDVQSILESYKERIDKFSEEGYKILTKNIDRLNSPTNRDKLVRTFELHGVALSEKDKETIDHRNNYLHGRSPLDPDEIFELTRISLRLHTLIVSLFLKYSGYNGHIINLDVYVYLDEDNLAIFLAELHQNLKQSLEDAQKTVESNDPQKGVEILQKVEEVLGNSKLKGLVRII